MRKILFCLEDYNELLFLETLLKKLGFSVESARNEFSLPDKMMLFSPDLVVATGDGAKINGARIEKKVKKKGQHAKLLLLYPREKLLSEQGTGDLLADGVIETPINPRRMITSICQLTGLEVDIVMAKFDKLPIAKDFSLSTEGIQIIHSQKEVDKNQTLPKVDGMASAERIKRYTEFLKNVPPSTETTFSHQKVVSELKDIRKYEQETDNTELEEQRKKFVSSLFKK